MEFDFSQHESVAEAEFEQKVPEQFRGAYVKDNGAYKINPSVSGVVQAVIGFSKALKGERTLTSQLKGQKDVGSAVKEALAEFGVEDLETARTKMAELTAAVAAGSKIDPKKIKAEIEATFAGERDKLKGENQKMFGTLRKYLVENAALQALSEHGGNSKLLMPVVSGAVEVVPDGDEYVVRVKDGDGQYRGNGMGGFMSVADYVKELKGSADYAVAFKSEAPSGGGGRGPTPNTRTQRQEQTRQNNENRSSFDKISAGLKNRRR